MQTVPDLTNALVVELTNPHRHVFKIHVCGVYDSDKRATNSGIECDILNTLKWPTLIELLELDCVSQIQILLVAPD